MHTEPSPEPWEDEMYRQIILEHNAHPQAKGDMPHASWSEKDTNPSCGDNIRIFAKIEDGILTDYAWNGTGCAISQASASMLTDMIRNMPVTTITTLGKSDIDTMLGIDVGATRMNCALLALKTLQKGIQEHESRT